MENVIHGPWPGLTRARKDRARDVEAAIRQLESAELYIVAVEGLELEDEALTAALEQLHGNLLLIQRHLRRASAAI